MIIFGEKTIALFDIWSIEHFISGILVGYTAIKFSKKNNYDFKVELLIVLLWAFSWETFEHYLETGLMGNIVKNWFCGVEFWFNRIIADPIMMIIGYIFYKKYNFYTIAKIFSFCWIILHVFIFPDSMYLHRFLPIIKF